MLYSKDKTYTGYFQNSKIKSMLNMILHGQKNLDLNRSNFVLLLIFINQLGCAQRRPLTHTI